jgi:hypothetical protein
MLSDWIWHGHPPFALSKHYQLAQKMELRR